MTAFMAGLRNERRRALKVAGVEAWAVCAHGEMEGGSRYKHSHHHSGVRLRRRIKASRRHCWRPSTVPLGAPAAKTKKSLGFASG